MVTPLGFVYKKMKTNTFSLAEQAIATGKRDVLSILERQKKEEEAQMLIEFEEQKQCLETLVNSEISELTIMSDNCEADKQKTGGHDLDFAGTSVAF